MPGLFFFMFVFSKVYSKHKLYIKICTMTGFEPWISCVWKQPVCQLSHKLKKPNQTVILATDAIKSREYNDFTLPPLNPSFPTFRPIQSSRSQTLNVKSCSVFCSRFTALRLSNNKFWFVRFYCKKQQQQQKPRQLIQMSNAKAD